MEEHAKLPGEMAGTRENIGVGRRIPWLFIFFTNK
jgi:hypothetical protein